MLASTLNMIVLLALLTLASAKPIMVTFGTHQGPIEPPQTTPKPAAPRSVDIRNPAPVSEETEDVPNPNFYHPLVPHQYRSKIYANPPPSNLILGTPIDQKYTPGIEKFELYKKQGRATGVNYTGPHFFERQEYEVLAEKRLKPAAYNKPQFYQKREKSVPQIGIVYSSGVRYYVPQIDYVANDKKGEEQQNSVYDKEDEKYFYRTKEQ